MKEFLEAIVKETLENLLNGFLKELLQVFSVGLLRGIPRRFSNRIIHRISKKKMLGRISARSLGGIPGKISSGSLASMRNPWKDILKNQCQIFGKTWNGSVSVSKAERDRTMRSTVSFCLDQDW